MDTSNNRLYDLEKSSLHKDLLQEIKDAEGSGNLEPVPEELNEAAKIKLNGNSTAQVSMNSGGRLSKWSASKRKKKRRTQKASRQRNRK